MTSTVTPFTPPSTTHPLTRKQRTWVALYALSSENQDRAEILRQNDVSEQDINEFIGGWIRLRYRYTMLSA